MASKPIVISIQGDTSGLSKALKGARGKLKDFGKSVGKFGVTSGAVFAATATAVSKANILILMILLFGFLKFSWYSSFFFSWIS